jgi:hypothetical protein
VAEQSPQSPVGTSPAPVVPARPSFFRRLVPGRPRADGLAPGSPEAAEADRKRDAERKRQERAEAGKLAEPPPLPPAGAPGAGPVPALGGPQSSLLPAPVAPAPLVLWQPDTLREFTDELVEAAEETRVKNFAAKAAEAKLPEKVGREVVKDSHFPAVAKRGLKLSTPKVAAKWLNKAGISAEYADEVTLAGSLLAIVIQGRRLIAKLDELIAAAKAPPPEPQKKTEAKP